jgi:hypothetical protein
MFLSCTLVCISVGVEESEAGRCEEGTRAGVGPCIGGSPHRARPAFNSASRVGGSPWCCTHTMLQSQNQSSAFWTNSCIFTGTNLKIKICGINVMPTAAASIAGSSTRSLLTTASAEAPSTTLTHAKKPPMVNGLNTNVSSRSLILRNPAEPAVQYRSATPSSHKYQ